MNCQKCKSERIVRIHGKCSDQFDMTYKDVSGNGYVPENLFFGKGNYGDYVEITFCVDCGQIQEKFPIPETAMTEAMNGLTLE